MDKGTRVKVVKGRQAVGATGTIFWTGPNKYGSGSRVGIKTDDGDTEWLDEASVEQISPSEDTERGGDEPEGGGEPKQRSAPTEDDGPVLEQGTRVRFTDRGQTGEGEVFWCGQNKFGPGLRLGIKDDAGEKHWLPASKATALEDQSGGGMAPPPDDGAPPLDMEPPPIVDDEPLVGEMESPSLDGAPPWDDDDEPPDRDYSDEEIPGTKVER